MLTGLDVPVVLPEYRLATAGERYAVPYKIMFSRKISVATVVPGSSTIGAC